MRPALILPLILSLVPPAQAADGEIVRRAAGAGFEQARENLVTAIEGRGLVVNHVARVGEMLERTGRDIGANAKLYGKAEVVEFCSAAVSRAMMAADPHNIVLCPYAIAVYTLPGQDGQAWISYRLPPRGAQGVKAVEDLLSGIVQEALK